MPPKFTLSTLHRSSYGWPLRQLRIPQAHKVTRGSAEVVVAAIDLGYRPHPDHAGHLWVNPRPTRGDIHGWDCHDDDATLENSFGDTTTAYARGHHAFIVGQIIACAPECPVMIVRAGYGNPDSWWRGIEYAVEHGARVLVIPHGYLPAGGDGGLLFSRGTDFAYPESNPRVREALEAAGEAGCLIVRGTADNRGRRVVFANAAIDAVMAVGSTGPDGDPADICDSAAYVEVAAPGGARAGGDPRAAVWSTGGDGDYIPMTGGCMAAGFAGGVAALVWSRFSDLTPRQLRAVLRNTAYGRAWDPLRGYGRLDAARAVGLDPRRLGTEVMLKRGSARLVRRRGGSALRLSLRNRGAFDAERAMAVVYCGDPRRPATRGRSQLVTCQLGHAVGAVRGLHETELEVDLYRMPPRLGRFARLAADEAIDRLWVQVFCLDRGIHACRTTRVKAGTEEP